MSFARDRVRDDVQPSLLDHLATATDLEKEGHYIEAHAAFMVAADLAEVLGLAELAQRTRIRARRNHVTEWARLRWPEEGILLEEVHASGGADTRRFAIQRPFRSSPNWPGFTEVAISRRGAVRVVRQR